MGMTSSFAVKRLYQAKKHVRRYVKASGYLMRWAVWQIGGDAGDFLMVMVCRVPSNHVRSWRALALSDRAGCPIG